MATRHSLTHARDHARRGFTLVEVLVAVVVLAIGATGLIQLLAQAQQQHHRRRSSDLARRIAENEIQQARSVGAWAVPIADTIRVNQYGAPDSAGDFRVAVTRDLMCDTEAQRPADDGNAPQQCPGAMARVTVRVEQLGAGTWTTRSERAIQESGNSPATGTWSPAGAN